MTKASVYLSKSYLGVKVNPVAFVEPLYAKVDAWLVDPVTPDHRDGLPESEKEAVQPLGETNVVGCDGPTHQALVSQLSNLQNA